MNVLSARLGGVLMTLAVTSLMATGCATTGAPRGRSEPAGEWRTVAYDNGYRAGFDQGAEDLRAGRPFDVAHHPAYERADAGYRRSDGDPDAYRRFFREAYEAGYTRGYRGYGARPPAREQAPPARRAAPRTGQGPSRDVHAMAYDNGYRDGYEKGIEDAERNRSSEPTRHSRFRSATRGYRRSDGPKAQYQDAYRDGFRKGYEVGYTRSPGPPK